MHSSVIELEQALQDARRMETKAQIAKNAAFESYDACIRTVENLARLVAEVER